MSEVKLDATKDPQCDAIHQTRLRYLILHYGLHHFVFGGGVYRLRIVCEVLFTATQHTASADSFHHDAGGPGRPEIKLGGE